MRQNIYTTKFTHKYLTSSYIIFGTLNKLTPDLIKFMYIYKIKYNFIKKIKCFRYIQYIYPYIAGYTIMFCCPTIPASLALIKFLKNKIFLIKFNKHYYTKLFTYSPIYKSLLNISDLNQFYQINTLVYSELLTTNISQFQQIILYFFSFLSQLKK